MRQPRSQFARFSRFQGRFALTLALLISLAPASRVAAIPLPHAPTEDHPTASAKFITPNEFENYRQYDLIDGRRFEGRDTAVIAVGTIRVFNLAARFRRDAAVSLDIASGIAEFNEEIAKLILENDRENFNRKILGVINPNADLKTREDFQAAASRSAMREVMSGGMGMKTGFQALIGKAGLSASLFYAEMGNYAADDKRWDAAFFGSDEAYDHVRRMIRGQRFFTVTASLSGSKGFKHASDFLRANGYVVSEIDVSNAFDYIAMMEGQMGADRLLDHLQRLPVTFETQVLFTVMGKTYQRLGINWSNLPLGGDRWNYLSVPLGKYIEALLFRDHGRVHSMLVDTFRDLACDRTLKGLDQGPKKRP